MFKKKFSITIFSIIMAISFTNISAESELQTRGTVSGSISFTSTSTTATLFEMPLPASTNKNLTGRYITKDVFGQISDQGYSGSILSGQLKVTKSAPVHFKSYRSYFSYSLNGILQPITIDAYY